MRTSDLVVPFRLTWGEILRSRALVLIVVFVALMLSIQVATVSASEPERAASFLVGRAVDVLMFLAILGCGAVIDGEYRSRRGEVLLVSGADESILVLAWGLARVVWFLVTSWIILAVGVGLVMVLGGPVHLSNLVFLLAVDPFGLLPMLALGIVLSSWMPGWTNSLGILATFMFLRLASFLGEKVGIPVDPAREILQWFLPVRFHSATAPGGLPIVYSDWWIQLLGVFGKTALLVGLAAAIARVPRLRLRSR